MANFKTRLFLGASLLVFVLSAYLLLTPANEDGKRPDNRFAHSNSRRKIPGMVASAQSYLSSSTNELINCTKIDQLCIDEQMITYQHTYEIIPQDVLDFSRVILLVTLNKPHFEAMPNVQLLYEKIFSKIIFCMPSISQLPENLLKFVNVTIIEYASEPSNPTGATFYMCLPIALDMLAAKGQADELRGILTISDDLIPNLWHFRHNRLPRDVLNRKLWLLDHQLDMFDIDSLKYCRGVNSNNSIDCDIKGEKPWPVQIENQPKIKAFYEEAKRKFPDFIKVLAEASRGKRRFFNNYADLFYVSSSYFDSAYDLLQLFGKHDIYMEFAVGTAFRGIVNDYHDIDYIDRSGQQGPESFLPPSETYDARRPIYHPFKMGRLDYLPFTEQCIFCSVLSMMNTYADTMLANRQ